MIEELMDIPAGNDYNNMIANEFEEIMFFTEPLHSKTFSHIM